MTCSNRTMIMKGNMSVFTRSIIAAATRKVKAMCLFHSIWTCSLEQWRKKLKNRPTMSKPMYSDSSQKIMKSIIHYNVTAQSYVGKAAMKVWA